MRRYLVGVLLILSCLLPVMAQAKPAEVVDQVWSGHPVTFAIAASKTQLYVAYYAADRQLTVAQRPLSGGAWRSVRLDTAVGWDSHNYITMAFDKAGRLHVAANMHVSKLTCYMSDRSGAVKSLKRVPVLVDAGVENRMTYPVFLHDRAGRLIYKYRDGGSGNGNDIYDVIDAKTMHWAHLIKTPLTDGEGRRNAYPMGPVMGPDGYFHLVWVWRETPDAATNHDLSYAKSGDLIHWEKASGEAVVLPMTLNRAEVIDPVPVKGGMINNNTLIGFDAGKRPVIAYHKYDAAGHTQIYVARFEGGKWHVAQASAWDNYRWDFGGNGSLKFEITLKAPYAKGDEIIVPVVRLGVATDLHLKAADLGYVGETPTAPSVFATDLAGITVPEGMQLNQATTQAAGKTFLLAWVTQVTNRDLPTAVIPPPGALMLFEK